MEIRETPWLTPESVSMLEKLIESNPGLKILEFGCGGSTIWFSRKLSFPDARLVSIEHNPEWYEAIRNEVPADVDLRLAARPYANVCDEFADESFDLVLVDGRDRIAVAGKAMRLVKRGGIFMLDNADRSIYFAIHNVLLKDWPYETTPTQNREQALAEGGWFTDLWHRPHEKISVDIPDADLVKCGEDAFRQGDIEKAEQLGRIALEKNACVVEAFNLLAVVCYSRNDVYDAAGLLEAALKLDPAHANAQKNLEIAYTSLGNSFELKTLTTFERGPEATNAWLPFITGRINQVSQDPQELIKIAGQLAERRRDDIAIDLLRMVLSQDPNNVRANHQLGIVFFHISGHQPTGLSYLEAAHRLAPQDPEITQDLALAYSHLGRHHDAERLTSPPSPQPVALQANQPTQAAPSRRRQPAMIDVTDPQRALDTARELWRTGSRMEALDAYEQLINTYPQFSVQILAEVDDCYRSMPDQGNRYEMYQSRLFDFDIKPSDKVLDIGSGHAPFPFATHLADFAVRDNNYGRAGVPFKHVDGKPVYECSVESLPFADNEFDFIYCSHVLEHVDDPEAACRELMRAGKRGYIETPNRGKDLWLDMARVSNHRWAIEVFNDTLIFIEYTPKDQQGLCCDALMGINIRPETPREKAISAVLNLKADMFNTMFMWDGSFKYEVRRLADKPRSEAKPFAFPQSVTQGAPEPVQTAAPASQPAEKIERTSEEEMDWLRMVTGRINQACGDPDKLIAIASELAEGGQDETAEELARMVINQNPNHADALNVLGVIYFERGKSRDALRYFESARRLDPHNADTAKNIIGVYTQMEQYEKAVTVCQELLAINPNDPELPQIIGSLLEVIGDEVADTMDSLGIEAAAPATQQPSRPAPAPSPAPDLSNYKPQLKYSFGMIVLNGDDFIEYALRSVYDFAHEIIIVEGAVQEALFMVGPDGGSRDRTIEMIESFPDPDHKIKLIRGKWTDKTEQSNVYMRLATGDYVWQLDSDEVYRWDDLVKIDQILAANYDRVDMVSIKALNFYHNIWTIGKGGRWEAAGDPIRRIFKNKPGAHFTTHWPPTLVYGDGTGVVGHLEQDTLADQFGIYFFHYSYVTKKQVEEKVEYYNRKGYSQIVGSDLSTWYERVWSKWTHPGCEVERLYGSHVNTRQPTWTEYFEGEHPEVMKSHPLYNFERPGHIAPAAPEFRNLAGQAETGCFAPVFTSLMQSHGWAPSSGQINKERHGTDYGGWWICPDSLSKESVVYSFGIGEDISFDLSVIEKYGVQVHAFDPTPRAMDYVSRQNVPAEFHAQGLAISAHDGEELFYPPDNSEHVSHTLVMKPQTATKALTVNVKKLATIMRELGHRHIDLLKMDIEGAEYEVLQDIIDSGVDVDQILVEFHHNVYPGLTLAQSQEMIDKMAQAGYQLFHVEGTDCSFIKDRSRDQVRVYNLGGRHDMLEFYTGADSSWLGKSVEYITVDINPNLKPDICNSVEDMRDIPDASADVLISTQVLMYSPNPDKAFREIARVLKPNGVFFCVTPMLYPRGEPSNQFYGDCTRVYSDKILGTQSCLQQLRRFTEIYGIDASPENLKEAMRLDDANHPAYSVYDLKEAEELFSKIDVYPAYDSPKAGTVNLVVVARK